MNKKKVAEPICPETKRACALAQELEQLKVEVLHLRNLVRVDPLTNFYNLRHFREALTVEMERTRRTGLPTGLIMADLDHFKSINDTYGHEVGNTALMNATTVWRDQIRQLDIPCRYGGEEFAIIMPGTRFSMAARAAERLRLVLSGRPFEHGAHQISMTASFGVDCFQLGENLTPEAFIERTDHYLLKAKQDGRNRVAFDQNRMDDRSTEVSIDERRQLFAIPTEVTEKSDGTVAGHSKIKSKGPTKNAE